MPAAVPPVDVPRMRRYELALPADPTAPGRARALLRQAAAEWGVDEEPMHDAAMIVTELVANAVDHAHTPSTLILGLDGRGLSVAVRDGNPGQGPRPRPVDPTARRGRGLQMVGALAASWGVTVHPDGKTVWAVLSPASYALGETSSGTA
jgi:anti-sigma regulatory factor (Ser/Thr protein kinase)